MRIRNVAVAIAVVVPTVALGGSALADANGQFKKVSIHYNAGVAGTGGGLVATDCDSSGQCVYSVSGGTGATLVGDLQGDYVENITVAVPASGGHPQAIASAAAFTGKVKRCGTGSFLATSVAIDTGSSFEGGYTIVPGSGTGDLVGITGSFRQSSDLPDVQGSVRCRVHD